MFLLLRVKHDREYHIYCVWLYLGSREYWLFDLTLAERKRRIGYPYRSCRTSVPFFRGEGRPCQVPTKKPQGCHLTTGHISNQFKLHNSHSSSHLFVHTLLFLLIVRMLDTNYFYVCNSQVFLCFVLSFWIGRAFCRSWRPVQLHTIFPGDDEWPFCLFSFSGILMEQGWMQGHFCMLSHLTI